MEKESGKSKYYTLMEKLKEEKRIRLIGVSNVREAIGYLNT